MTSPSPRTICFVYFALLFRTANANNTIDNTTNSSVGEGPSKNISIQEQLPSITTISNNDSINANTTTVANTKSESVTISQPSASPKPSKGQCILLLPTGDKLQLVVFALIVGCFALLVTTLICICQVCHLRGIISSLQPGHNKSNIDLRAIREKSESPHWDEGQVDRQPTETCLMLSEVTTAQEESREDEERVLENKDTEQPGTEKDPNGDITQENSHEPEAKAPESSDTGV